MISAPEALIIAQNANEQKLIKQLNYLDNQIRNTAKSGGTNYFYDGNISKLAKRELKKLGYQIETSSQYNNPYVVIKWD